MQQRSIMKLYAKKLAYRAFHWETWHWFIKYIPMLPFWMVYCVKARSLWFFTAANPTLTFGGFDGERKTEMYAQLPDGTFPRTFLIPAQRSFSEVENRIQSSDFSFPIAVKPDVGQMGLMFRKINSLQELREYHTRMKVDYLLQEFVAYELEVSVFYHRMPGNQMGTITGFVRKESLSVTGDGTSTLSELMDQYPRVWFRMDEMKLRHADNLNMIIAPGMTYVLCDALNLSRGGKLVSLEREKDEKLLRLFDQISHQTSFYFGRYDIKCASLDDLKEGKNFSILEFNGSGAEPHHVYGNGNSLFKAIRILLHHWKILYLISVANHKNGVPYWSHKRGAQHLMEGRTHFNRLRSLEMSASTPTTESYPQIKSTSPLSTKILAVKEVIREVNTNGTI